MSSKSARSSPRAMPVETIITRFKSAQQKRQLREMDRSMTKITELLKNPVKPKAKNPKTQPKKTQSKMETETKKDTLDEEVKSPDITEIVEEEYYPMKLKRQIVLNKVQLKPKHDLKIIAKTNKRKRSIPHKGLYTEDYEEVIIGSSRESSPETKRAKLMTVDMTMEEMIQLIEESDSLDDEDLLEILTCPSPVWWEDPPDGYNENALFTRPRSSAEMYPSVRSQLKDNLERKRSNTPNVLSRRERKRKSIDSEVDTRTKSSVDVNIKLNNCDEKFKQKRSKLESVLGNLKNKNVSEVKVSKPISKASVISESGSDFNKVSVIKNVFSNNNNVVGDGKIDVSSKFDVSKESDQVVNEDSSLSSTDSTALEIDEEHITDISFDDHHLSVLENMDIPTQDVTDIPSQNIIDISTQDTIDIPALDTIHIPTLDTIELLTQDLVSTEATHKDIHIPTEPTETSEILNENTSEITTEGSNVSTTQTAEMGSNSEASTTSTTATLNGLPTVISNTGDLNDGDKIYVYNPIFEDISDISNDSTECYKANVSINNFTAHTITNSSPLDLAYGKSSSFIEEYFEMNLFEDEKTIVHKKQNEYSKNELLAPLICNPKYDVETDLSRSVIKFKNPDSNSIHVVKFGRKEVPKDLPPLKNCDKIKNTGRVPDHLPPLRRNPGVIITNAEAPKSLKDNALLSTSNSVNPQGISDSISDKNVCFLNEDDGEGNDQGNSQNIQTVNPSVIRSSNSTEKPQNGAKDSKNENPNQSGFVINDSNRNKLNFPVSALNFSQNIDKNINLIPNSDEFHNDFEDLDIQSLTITKINNTTTRTKGKACSIATNATNRNNNKTKCNGTGRCKGQCSRTFNKPTPKPKQKTLPIVNRPPQPAMPTITDKNDCVTVYRIVSEEYVAELIKKQTQNAVPTVTNKQTGNYVTNVTNKNVPNSITSNVTNKNVQNKIVTNVINKNAQNNITLGFINKQIGKYVPTVTNRNVRNDNSPGVTNNRNYVLTNGTNTNIRSEIKSDATKTNVRNNLTAFLTNKLTRNGITPDLTITQTRNYVTTNETNKNVLNDVTPDVTITQTQNYVTTHVTNKNILNNITPDVGITQTQNYVTTSVTNKNILNNVTPDVAITQTRNDVTTNVTNRNVRNVITAVVTNTNFPNDITSGVTNTNFPNDITAAVTNKNTLNDVINNVTKRNVHDVPTEVTNKDVQNDVTADVTNSEVRNDVNNEVTSTDIPTYVTADVTNREVRDDVNNEVTNTDVLNDVTADVTNREVLNDVNNEVTKTDVLNNVRAEISDGDVRNDVTTDITYKDARNDVTADVIDRDVRNDVTTDLIDIDIRKDVATDVTDTDIRKDVKNKHKINKEFKTPANPLDYNSEEQYCIEKSNLNKDKLVYYFKKCKNLSKLPNDVNEYADKNQTSIEKTQGKSDKTITVLEDIMISAPGVGNTNKVNNNYVNAEDEVENDATEMVTTRSKAEKLNKFNDNKVNTTDNDNNNATEDVNTHRKKDKHNKAINNNVSKTDNDSENATDDKSHNKKGKNNKVNAKKNKKVTKNSGSESESEKEKKCINVSNTNEMRYCRTCSSIFDTPRCNYCFKDDSGKNNARDNSSKIDGNL